MDVSIATIANTDQEAFAPPPGPPSRSQRPHVDAARPLQPAGAARGVDARRDRREHASVGPGAWGRGCAMCSCARVQSSVATPPHTPARRQLGDLMGFTGYGRRGSAAARPCTVPCGVAGPDTPPRRPGGRIGGSHRAAGLRHFAPASLRCGCLPLAAGAAHPFMPLPPFIQTPRSRRAWLTGCLSAMCARWCLRSAPWRCRLRRG